MADDSKANAALAMGTGAAVAGALLWITRAKGVVAQSFPPEAMELLVAIANSVAQVAADIKTLLERLASLAIQGFPPNQSGWVVTRIQAAALDQWYQFPDMVVPEGYTLLLKAAPANAAVIFVGPSRAEVTNQETAWPLLPNEMLRLQVQNFNQVFVAGITASGSAVGDWVYATVEVPRRTGG